MVLDHLAVPVGALATAIYTLYWLITIQNNPIAETKCNELVIDYSLMIVCLFLNIRVYLAMFIGTSLTFYSSPAYRLKLPCKD